MLDSSGFLRNPEESQRKTEWRNINAAVKDRGVFLTGFSGGGRLEVKYPFPQRELAGIGSGRGNVLFGRFLLAGGFPRRIGNIPLGVAV